MPRATRHDRRLRSVARWLTAMALVPATTMSSRRAVAQTHDPSLVWTTLETAHFRIHHHQGLEVHAQRVADVGEMVYRRVGDIMGWHPRQITEIVLTDHTDDANGDASAVPYNLIHLFITAPEDLSTLGEYDDWIQSITTHEFTHITHTDNVSGLPALINAILGKVYPPNQVQPRWILEGIAVWSESRNTTGGRLRNSTWDMYLRADALANDFITLDQLGAGPERWPHGDLYYLYGSQFIQWIVEHYGEVALRRISSFYGSQLIPYGINRAAARATGQTYEQLYPRFLADMRTRYLAQRDAIVARGLRGGERITRLSGSLAYPRFLPDGRTVAFQTDDGEGHLQIRAVDATTGRVAPRTGNWTERISGFALSADGARLVVADTGFWRDIYAYNELYERAVHLRADGALVAQGNAQLTHGLRGQYPDVSPDGDHVAFSSNHRGTRTLFEYSLAEGRARPLLRVPRFEQVYTPRYAPDGRSIVFSQWQRGGMRDVRILDRATGAVRDVTHDRALDMQPVWSPDGRYVVFCSDRTGVANLFAYELATGTLRQVTNVVLGAFMPAISPDGRTLVYVGYGPRGFDLYRMPFDPAQWLDAPEPAPDRGPSPATPHAEGRTHPYEPWSTLRPHSWTAGIDNDGFGYRVSLLTQGADVLGNHAYNARVSLGLVDLQPQFDVSYYYSGLRPTLRVHAYRDVGAATWHVGRADPLYAVDRSGGEAEVSASFPELFAGNSVSFAYEAQRQAPVGGVPFGRFVDPNEPATVPPRTLWTSGLRASWHYSNAQRYGYDISAHEGLDALVSFHATDRALGSTFGGVDVSAALAGYIPMPWGAWRRHHVLALRAAGGVSTNDQGEQAQFYVGGFPTYGAADFVSAIASYSASSGVALRGYPQFARGGSRYYLCNAEYRFPIWQIDRGPATLPLYVSRLYGGAYADAGNAWFGRVDFGQIAVGVGGELLADVVLGYVLPFTVRIGLARGLTGADATWETYALFSSPF